MEQQLSCDIAVQSKVVNLPPLQRQPNGVQSMGGMHGYC